MKPIIVENSRIPKILSLVINIGAITLWPFVFVRGKADERIVRHESIHIAQYNELFVIGFLALYLYDWVKGLIKYRDKEKAYNRIRFEQEAYMYDAVDGYLWIRSRSAYMQFHAFK
jgi:hypothetical protein